MNGRYKTMTSMWHEVCERLLFSRKGELDAWSGVQGSVFNNMFQCEAMDFEFDIGRDVWLTSYRFPKLQRDYLDPNRVQFFVDRCVAIANGAGKRGVIAEMRTRNAVNSRGEEQHSWGNCMLGYSFHGGVKGMQPTFALYSRACFMAYLGPLDLSLAYVLAREVARRLDRDMKEFAFVWYLGSAQWHSMKSCPYVVSQGLYDEIHDRSYDTGYPVITKTRWVLKQLETARVDGVAPTRENFRYGPVRRMNGRYQRVLNGDPLPSIPVESLELLPQFRGE